MGAFRQKRGDSKIGNISDLPAKVKAKYRSDASLNYVLDKERVVSLTKLREKYRNS